MILLGHMIQGDWIEPNGYTSMPVSVYFDLLRLWDSRAVWWKMEADTSALRDNIRFAESRNAQVMFAFGEPPESALASGFKKVPTMDAWERFIVRVIAEGKDRIDVYEGWNEPGYPQYWDGTPEMLVPYQRALYQLVKPLGKVVLSPSFVRVELPDGREFLERFKKAGGFQYCDGVAWHGYAARPEDLRGQIESLRSFTSLPLWNTEFTIGYEFDPSVISDAIMLQNSLGIRCAVLNAEMPGFEDYTNPTMALVRSKLLTSEAHGGCSLLHWLRK